MQTCRRFQVGLFLFFVLAALFTRTNADEKWNVLLVTADDMNTDSLGMDGKPIPSNA
ncbi:MAG: hypothetical protein U0905_10700 [Pirellulales bacterium]